MDDRRYVVDELEHTYLIIDNQNRGIAYLLFATSAISTCTTQQITIAEVPDSQAAGRYVVFGREIWTNKFYAPIDIIWNTMDYIINCLHQGMSVDNPAELLPDLGGELCGKKVWMPSPERGH